MSMTGHPCDPRLLQWPQPTRPLHSYGVSSECHTPKDTLLPHQFWDSELQHSPPTHNYGTIFESHVPQEYCHHVVATPPTTEAAAAGGGEEPDEVVLSVIAAGEGEEPDEVVLSVIEHRLEELHFEAGELLRKFFSKLEKEVPLEKCLKQGLQDPRVRGVSELFERLQENLGGQVNLWGTKDGNTMRRSLSISTCNLHGPVEELPEKLERFKIRTVDIGGVVKEEPKENCETKDALRSSSRTNKF